MTGPARLIATCFGIGNLPRAPGTWGSLAALPIAWIVLQALGPVWLAVAAVLVFVLGWWASEIVVRDSPDKDPGSIVIDEVAGQMLTLAAAPLAPEYFAAGFVLFRIADIWKPWPVSWADRRVAGGLGVMVDDMLTGLYAAIVLYALVMLMG